MKEAPSAAFHLRDLRSLCFILFCSALVALLTPVRGEEHRGRQIEQSLSRATAYLVNRQDDDGLWRSGVHGSFRDGPSLTPHVLSTLMVIGADHPAARQACRGGIDRMTAMLNPRDAGLHFPVYTAAEISWSLTMDGRAEILRARSAWIDFLRDRQLNARLGWTKDDPSLGGWGYSPLVPNKPKPGEPAHPLTRSNLSATLFAIGALRLAGAGPDDPAMRDALVFVERCQNFAGAGSTAGVFDDGGFVFGPDDPAGNKPGSAGTDSSGQPRLHSYGSMTADGLRALLVCGLPHDHERVVAARLWLERHFTVTTNPGNFEPDRAALADSTYYYYAWSLAHALDRLHVREIDTPDGKIDWAAALADELMRRQREDGSWANRFSDAKEDDPLVATPFAAAALEICRRRLGESAGGIPREGAKTRR